MTKKIRDEWAPLSAGFMLTSIFGFLLSIWFVMDFSVSWGFAFAFFFVIMFVASLISMTKAEPIPSHMNQLAIHEPNKAYVPLLKKRKTRYENKSFKWFEPIFFLFLAVWLFYVVSFILGNIDYTPFYLAVGFFSFTIFFAVFFLADIFSNEVLPLWEQIFFASIIIVTASYGSFFFPIAGIGVLVYYLHIKVLQKPD